MSTLCDARNDAQEPFRDIIVRIIEDKTVFGIDLIDHRYEVGCADDAGPAADAIMALVQDEMDEAYARGYEAGRLAERASLFVRTATPGGGKR